MVLIGSEVHPYRQPYSGTDSDKAIWQLIRYRFTLWGLARLPLPVPHS